MKTITNTSFEGERPLFKSNSLHLDQVIIHAGESALKECKNFVAVNCEFEGKYPFWHNENTKIGKCIFRDGARAAIWYSNNLEMKDSTIEAPTLFNCIQCCVQQHCLTENVTIYDSEINVEYLG